MRIQSLIASAVRNGPWLRAARRQVAPRTDGAPRPASALREEILTGGLDAERALALADALEREGRLVEAVDALVVAGRLRRDPGLERRLVRLRRAAVAQLDTSLAPVTWPHFALEDGPLPPPGPLEIRAAELTPRTLRTGIQRHGHLLVRGLVPPARVARLCEAIDRTFDAQKAVAATGGSAETAPWCDPLDDLPDGAAHRAMVRAAHGVLAVDSPRALFEFFETVHDLGIDALLTAYLGERPGLSAQKCTLRRVDASDWKIRLSNWHQDGAFLGRGIRTVDAWFALSPCGRDAPGMDLVPVRLPRLLPRGEGGTAFDWTVAPETIARELPGVPIWRPEFEAGDVLFFDDWSLHRTAADEGMPNLRYAIESWWFAPSAYLEESFPATFLLA